MPRERINPPSDWARLFRIACSLIDQVNASSQLIDHWTLGGGTALMIHIDHRESRDVDIFLPDPQLLSFLDPTLHDFRLESDPQEYVGDGARFLKIAFDFGEIDFIVAQAKTDVPSNERQIEGTRTLLETVAEIITKKVVYRGSNIRPRDIFDVAAAARRDSDELIAALRPYRADVSVALERMGRLNPEFVRAANQELSVRPGWEVVMHESFPRALELLRAV